MKRRLAIAIAAAALAAPPVLAHQVMPGVTGLPGAALHTLTAADQVMALVAVGLLAGLNRWRGLGAAMAGLVVGFAAGFADLLYGPTIPQAWLGALVVALVAALASAFNLKPYPAVAFAFAAVIGAVIGIGAQPSGETWADIANTGAGTLLGIVIIEVVPGVISALIRAGWPRVLIRVAASWIAASSLMVLAFALAPLVRG